MEMRSHKCPAHCTWSRLCTIQYLRFCISTFFSLSVASMALYITKILLIVINCLKRKKCCALPIIRFSQINSNDGVNFLENTQIVADSSSLIWCDIGLFKLDENEFIVMF